MIPAWNCPLVGKTSRSPRFAFFFSHGMRTESHFWLKRLRKPVRSDKDQRAARSCALVKEPGVQRNALGQNAMHLENQERRRRAMNRSFLWYSDTRLGVLTPYETDWPWTFCHFVADPPFAGLQPLFEESYQLVEHQRQGGDREAWERAYEKIAALGLFLQGSFGRRGNPWRSHIHEQVAWFRLSRPYWQREA